MKRACALVLCIAPLMAGCLAGQPARRSLPEWIETIHVPIFANETAHPGIEELATLYTIEEFLSDGRLTVTQRYDADIVLRVTIEEYDEVPRSFESDDFAAITQIRTVADLKLRDPAEPDKNYANLTRVRPVISIYEFVSDPRRTDLQSDAKAQEYAMRDLSRQIVRRVITGYEPPDRFGAIEEPVDDEFDLEGVLQPERGVTIQPSNP